MSKVKENFNLETVFGNLDSKVIWSNSPLLAKGDIVTITNSNCEFEFDSIEDRFVEGPIYAFIVNLELIDYDLSKYIPSKSNNGGAYAFGKCKVIKIIEEGY